jgi:hypothetical protein
MSIESDKFKTVLCIFSEPVREPPMMKTGPR